MARRGAPPVSFRPDEEFRARFGRLRANVARLSVDDADDAVQEAFARALQHRVPGDIEPWLRTVSRRIAIDNVRRRREYATGTAIDVDRLRPPAAASPEDVVLGRESVGLIRHALRSLPRRYRDVLVAYSEDRDNSAVAARLGLSSTGTRSLLCRARTRLRAELDRIGYAASAIVLRAQRWHDHAAAATVAACAAAVIVSTPAIAPATHNGRPAVEALEAPSAPARQPIVNGVPSPVSAPGAPDVARRPGSDGGAGPDGDRVDVAVPRGVTGQVVGPVRHRRSDVLTIADLTRLTPPAR